MIEPEEGQAAPPRADAETAVAEDGISVLGTQLEREWTTLEAELDEIKLLAQQARTEATRHEEKRVAAAAKLDAARRPGNEVELVELATQLATLTRRAGLMQTSVEVLEGKLKTLTRYRDSVASTAEALAMVGRGEIPPAILGEIRTGGTARSSGGAIGSAQGLGAIGALPLVIGPDGEPGALPPAVSRLVLAAQEELRREIARTMHDGPAQSLTNIVLQAQIVERLLRRDPEQASGEVRQLIAMVQQTLDATKSFIFDVRPMVLDDLGLVPTIRRAARERGRRAQTPVEFESFGTDRRLATDLESGLFRILDEALAAFLQGRPARVVIRLDWADGLEARVRAVRPEGPEAADRGTGGRRHGEPVGTPDGAEPETGKVGGRLRRNRPVIEEQEAFHPQMTAMIESTHRAERRTGGLPAAAWREIQGRAATLGFAAELLDDGHELRVSTAQEPDEPQSA